MISALYRRLKRAPKAVALIVLAYYVGFKHWVLGPYYRGLATQAAYLYRRSPLFRDRCAAIDFAYAEESFSGDTGVHFFHLAQKENWKIRLQIFIDATLGRPLRPYYVETKGEHKNAK